MSTLRTNTIQNTAGVEQYLAKAWVNFNGTGTVAIRAAGNVSSITDNGVGDYRANLSISLVDTNFAVISTPAGSPYETRAAAISQTEFGVTTFSAGIATDASTVQCAVFR